MENIDGRLDYGAHVHARDNLSLAPANTELDAFEVDARGALRISVGVVLPFQLPSYVAKIPWEYY